MTRNKWPLAIAAGAFTTALVGGVALAGLQLPVGDAPIAATVPAVTDTAATRVSSKTKLKEILDGLVAKGTITQAQADAILKAVKDAEPTPKTKPVRPAGPSVRSFVGELSKAASSYLGMDQKTLLTQLRAGKSLADIANGLSAQGKTAAGLIDTLTKTANEKVDQAVAANKLTAEQAAALKAKIGAEITTFVNRSFTKPMLPRPLTPVKPTATPTS
jgi:polyhydroxyalkanoate synthesis regulator phasin